MLIILGVYWYIFKLFKARAIKKNKRGTHTHTRTEKEGEGERERDGANGCTQTPRLKTNVIMMKIRSLLA